MNLNKNLQLDEQRKNTEKTMNRASGNQQAPYILAIISIKRSNSVIGVVERENDEEKKF